jgi:hypothetical protein
MKKIAICLMITCLSLTLLPLQSNAAATEPASSLTAPKTAESAEANTLIMRLNEIKSMDMSKLKPADKKNLRKEVRSINHRLRAVGGGVYLSAGAVIIILIILIIIL